MQIGSLFISNFKLLLQYQSPDLLFVRFINSGYTDNVRGIIYSLLQFYGYKGWLSRFDRHTL